MTWACPQLLWLLLLPAAWLARELSHRRAAAADAHPRIQRAEAGWRGLSEPAERSGRSAAAGARLWLCAGAVLAIAALARPQWGRIDEPVFDQSREVILALDLSRSMLSTDVKPSRLDRSKLLIESLLDHLKGERVGLIIFSGTAFLQSPLSADYEILREFLPALGPNFLPEGGTNYRALLDTALDAFGGGAAADRYLVILSDGEATDEHWQARLPELKRRGIHVIGLGVGTTGGSMIPDGSGGFVKDDAGAVVLSKLESGTLRELAEASQGAYRDASAWVDVAALIQSTVDAGRKGRFVEHQSVRYAERFQWALAPALFCLLASFWREFPVRTRTRDLRLPPSAGRGQRNPDTPGTAAAPRAAAAGTLLALAGLAGFGGGPARAAGLGPGTVQPFLAQLSAPPPAASASSRPQPAAPQAPPPPAAGVARIVGRLAGQARSTALDWSELARETINWGHTLESSQQAVPEGPVRDALAGVAVGAQMDPDSRDWASLRSELEQLLHRSQEQKQPPKDQPKPPEQDPKNSPPKDSSAQNQSGQNPPQQKSSPNHSSSSSGQSPPGQPQPGEPPPPSSNRDGRNQQGEGSTPPPAPGSPGNPGAKPPDRPPQEGSAFGDMKPPTPPPDAPPPSAGQGPMQKVGGAAERPPTDPARADPALAGSLDKLQQIGDRDSPAELFELMRRGDPAAEPVKKGKTW
jgi:Ca-activated chloride channel family protein